LKPLVTCICPTMPERRAWLPRAIECFESQTYSPRELVIVGDDLCLGDKRNLACSLGRGEIIAHWDDDDFSYPGRLADQVTQLIVSGKSVTGYHTLRFLDLCDTQIVENGRPRKASGWWRWRSQEGLAAGTSLCYRRAWWEHHPFPSVRLGEDDLFWREAMAAGEVIAVDGCRYLCATNHRDSISGRLAGGIEWEELHRG
jgi:O-antigen biosynthesis protein